LCWGVWHISELIKPVKAYLNDPAALEPDLPVGGPRAYPPHLMRTKIPADLRQFAMVQPEVEAVVQRIGRDTWDLLLIDVDGNWDRGVFESKEQAVAVADALGLPVHDGWDDARMAKRMNKRDNWNQPGGQKRAL
jgi:hypothetical protein